MVFCQGGSFCCCIVFILDNNTFLYLRRRFQRMIFFFFGAPCYFFYSLKVLCGLMFIYDEAFMEVLGSYRDQRHGGSHRFAWCVAHCRRLLIKTLTGREEWTCTENRGMTVGSWNMCGGMCVCMEKKNKQSIHLSCVFVPVCVLRLRIKRACAPS